MAAALIDMAWLEATRLVALYCREDLKIIRARTSGTRGPRPPKQTWFPRKLAMHLTVEGADESPGTVAKGLGRSKGTVYHALDDIARAREENGELDMDLRGLELRMMHWRARVVGRDPPGHILATSQPAASPP